MEVTNVVPPTPHFLLGFMFSSSIPIFIINMKLTVREWLKGRNRHIILIQVLILPLYLTCTLPHT